MKEKGVKCKGGISIMKLRLYNSGIVEVQCGWFTIFWKWESGKERSQIGKGKMVKRVHCSSDGKKGMGKTRYLKPEVGFCRKRCASA